MRPVSPRLGSRRASATLLLLGAALGVGCDPGVFGDLEDGASTRVFGAIDGFPSGTFGRRLATVSAPFGGGIEASRVAAVGGASSPFAVYGVWTENQPDLGVRAEGCNDGLDDGCPPGFGTDVAGIPAYGGLGACFVVTAPEGGETRVYCEGEAGGTVIAQPALAAEELGRSVAGVPAVHPAGVAFLGAPAAGSESGALYRLADAATVHSPVALPASLALAPGDRFGDAMAATIDPMTGAVLLAVTASGADRVYVLSVDGDGLGGTTTELLACLDGGAGFGASLAFGDLTGEGDPELAIGEAIDAPGRTETVRVYALADLAGEAGCGVAAAPPSESVACPADLGVECVGSGFGASLAIGDVDADAIGDLLVGAPLATVAGEREAGAAFLLAGNLSGVASLGQDRDVLVDSDPGRDARLGTAVALPASHLNVSAVPRAEPVASAPGEGKLFVFLCTDLEPIASLADSRCLELD